MLVDGCNYADETGSKRSSECMIARGDMAEIVQHEMQQQTVRRDPGGFVRYDSLLAQTAIGGAAIGSGWYDLSRKNAEKTQQSKKKNRIYIYP